MTHITIERAKLALADATQSAMTSHNSEGDQVICIEPHLWKQLREAIQALAAQPAIVQEPFGYVYEVYCLPECAWEMDWVESFDRYEPDAEDNIRNVIPVYTTPPAAQRQWVGLTDDQIEAIWYDHHDREMGYAMRFSRAIEDKLKEKNNENHDRTCP